MQLACNISKVCWFPVVKSENIRHLNPVRKERKKGMAFSSVKWVKLCEGARLNFGFTLGWGDERLNILRGRMKKSKKKEWIERYKRREEKERSLPWLTWVLVLSSSSACWDCRFDIFLESLSVYARVDVCTVKKRKNEIKIGLNDNVFFIQQSIIQSLFT